MFVSDTSAPQSVGTFFHVRSSTDGKFLCDDGRWSSRMTAARVFATAKTAADFCRTEKLKMTEIVVLCEKSAAFDCACQQGVKIVQFCRSADNFKNCVMT